MSHDSPAVLLERYRPLLDDPGAFADALSRPLPGCVWVHAGRIPREAFAELLQEQGIEASPCRWHREAFLLPHDVALGRRWWVRAGLCHVQEEASLLPVAALGARPGERVLDLCAAPGGKTAQLALAVGHAGTVVANEVAIQRMSALRSNLDRLGLPNVVVTRADGGGYPREAGLFDRVLVDAPCSNEGTLRKNPRLLLREDRRPTGLQAALLRRAVRLCRPGGRVVYSTCTFAPEENEEVVDAVLRDPASPPLRLLPIEVPGLRLAPGVTSWAGRALDPSLALAARLWPHHNDTGGFFAALLERGDGPVEPQPAPSPPAPAPEDEWRPFVSDRFGIDARVWDDLLVFRRSTRGLHATTRAVRPPQKPEPESIGLLLAKDATRFARLSATGGLFAGRHATRNRVELDEAQVEAYFAVSTFPLEAQQTRECTSSGIVVARHRGYALGIGLYREADRTLESFFPRRWSD